MTFPAFSVKLDHEEFFNRYNLDIHFPPPPVVKKPTVLQKTWKKVCAFFRKIWDTICFWRQPTNFKLTSKQLKLIKQAKEKRKYLDVKKHTVKQGKTGSKKGKEIKLSAHPIAAKSPESIVLSYPEDPTFSAFCEFAEQFVEIAVLESVNTHKIKPGLPALKQTLLNNLDQVKIWIDLIANLKKAISPLFHKLGSLDDSSLTILAQVIFQVFLEPLEKGEDPKADLKKSIAKKIEILKINEEISSVQYESILDYIEPTLQWLFNSNNWLVNSPHPKFLHHFFIDSMSFLNTFSRLSKQGELDRILKAINAQLDETFEEDVQKTLKLNTKKITNLLTSRLSHLLQQGTYPKAFNGILQAISEQIDGWVAADKKYRQLDHLIKNSQNDIELRATNVSEVQKQQQAQDFLAKVEAEGGVSQYLEKNFTETFLSTPACHKKLSGLLTAKTAKEAAKIEDELFDSFIDSIIPTLLPPRKILLPDGSEVEVCGMSHIIDSLEYSSNFNHLFELGDGILDLVLEQGQYSDKENFKQYFTALKKVILAQMISNKVREVAKKGLRSLFSKLASKELLDEILGQTILPSLTEVIFVGWVRATIERHVKILAPLFHKVIISSESENLSRIELTDYLFGLMGKQANKFIMEEAGISKSAFVALIQPLIAEILEGVLKQVQEEHPSEEISLSEVQQSLQEYFKPEKVAVNHLYGEISMKSLFQVTSFKLPKLEGLFLKLVSTETVIGWYKETIAEQASIAFEDIEASPHFPLKCLVEAGNEHLLKAEKLNSLFFPPDLSPEEAQAKKASDSSALAEGIQRISNLVHDTLYRSLENRKMGYFIKGYAPSPDTLQSTITTIFDRLLCRPLLNKNLYAKVLDIASDALGQAAEHISAEKAQGH